MADITSGSSVKVNAPLSGVNLTVIETPATADDGDTIDLSTLLGNGETPVKVLWAWGVQDPTGTEAAEPIGYTDTTDVLTIGGSTDNARRDIVVFWK